MTIPQPGDVPYGTLDLMVLKTLQAMGPQHGFGIARRIEQQGLIASRWGTSDNNRRAKYYAITKAGEKHLAAESKQWARMVAIISGVLEAES